MRGKYPLKAFLPRSAAVLTGPVNVVSIPLMQAGQTYIRGTEIAEIISELKKGGGNLFTEQMLERIAQIAKDLAQLRTWRGSSRAPCPKRPVHPAAQPQNPEIEMSFAPS